MDALYSWKFCQVYPIKLIRQKKLHEGFMVINHKSKEIIFLDECSMETLYRTCDYLLGNLILSLRKNKKNPLQLLLEYKFKSKSGNEVYKMKGRYCIEFISHDYDSILMNILDLTSK